MKNTRCFCIWLLFDDQGFVNASAASRLSIGAEKRSFCGFGARPTTCANFSGDFHSEILISEIKTPGTRRAGRFTVLQIPTAEPCSVPPELGSASHFSDS